jgi:haloalkane dehalogenase
MTYRQLPVLGTHMAYTDTAGSGPTVLFLHGNPASSFIWRDVIPHVAPLARCIAPDLIGFGKSGKPDLDYRFQDHVRYLDAFVEGLKLKEVFLVGQDWGAALALHFATRFSARMLGLAFMEHIRAVASWEAFHPSEQARHLFQQFRTPGIGEQLIMEENVFIERILPGTTLRTLSAGEMDIYREAFPTPASRKPVWRFPNELPIAGAPADMAATIAADEAAVLASEYPKLFFSADPGATVSPAAAAEIVSKARHCRHIALGAGRHNLQEDHPHAIGQALAGWIAALCPPTRLQVA